MFQTHPLRAGREQGAIGDLGRAPLLPRATAYVEGASPGPGAGGRVTRYLEAVAEALRPASAAFRRDLSRFGPARELYEQNTVAAAGRIRESSTPEIAEGAFRRCPLFVARSPATMRRITSGELGAATGLDDAAAYSELAKLMLAAVALSPSPLLSWGGWRLGTCTPHSVAERWKPGRTAAPAARPGRLEPAEEGSDRRPDDSAPLLAQFQVADEVGHVERGSPAAIRSKSINPTPHDSSTST